MVLGRPKQKSVAEKWLELDAATVGTLAFKDPVNLMIKGRFEGSLDTKGKLSIAEKAYVKADIRGESITVAGTVNGDVAATGRVELLGTARVTGKISSPRVVLHEGAVFNGALEMGNSSERPLMTVEDLARYLEVEVSTVVEWAKSGRIPSQRQANAWYFERPRIEEWLAQEKIK